MEMPTPGQKATKLVFSGEILSHLVILFIRELAKNDKNDVLLL